MKVLVIGATGMLGHVVHSYLSERAVKVFGATRDKGGTYPVYCNLLERDSLETAVELGCWDAVVNCAGIVTKIVPSCKPEEVMAVNGVAPHIMAEACARTGARFIHISTDCVFSGKRGGYDENDTPDATDLYGVSKLLGEVKSPSLTIRTSIIGPEIAKETTGLFEWFKKQTLCWGFTNQIWSGVTTLQLARTLYSLLLRPETPRGILHVNTKPISKYELLNIINDEFQFGVKVDALAPPNGHDKSLCSYRGDLGIPDIRKQLQDLKAWMNK